MKNLTNYDYQRYFTYFKFGRLNYKDLFIFNTNFILNSYFKNTSVYIYGGKFWFKIRLNSLRAGFRSASFILSKQIAIYKKKQHLKKVKKK